MDIRTIRVDGEEFAVKSERYLPASTVLGLVHKHSQRPYQVGVATEPHIRFKPDAMIDLKLFRDFVIVPL